MMGFFDDENRTMLLVVGIVVVVGLLTSGVLETGSPTGFVAAPPIPDGVVGGRCVAGIECISPAYCDLSTKKCVEPTCDRDSDCPSGSYCLRVIGGTCQPLQACNQNSDCRALGRNICRRTAVGETKFCYPPAAQNAPCDTNIDCASKVCQNNRCAAPLNKPVASCRTDAQCSAGKFCQTALGVNVCVNKLGEGARCFGPSNCLSNACANSFCAARVGAETLESCQSQFATRAVCIQAAQGFACSSAFGKGENWFVDRDEDRKVHCEDSDCRRLLGGDCPSN